MQFLFGNKKTLDPAKLFKQAILLRLLILGGILIVAVLGLWFTSQAVTKEAAQTKELRAENKWLLNNFEVIAAISDGERKISGLRNELLLRLPKTLEFPTKISPALKSLAVLRRLTGVIIQLGTENNSDPSTFSFTVKADGALNDVFGFIADIETQKPIMQFDTLDVASLGQGRFELSLGVQMYTRQ